MVNRCAGSMKVSADARLDHEEAVRYSFARQTYVLKGEDASCTCDLKLADGTTMRLYGVFDGHGGARAAQFAAENLPRLIHAHFTAARVGSRAERLRGACKAAFIECDKLFAAGSSFGDGTTASVVILDADELTSANVGDSTMMLFLPGGEAVILGMDHRVERRTEEEHQRVMAAGATIGRIKGVSGMPVGPLRLYPGGLTVTRSIGDSDSTSACIAEPAVATRTVPPTGFTVVLATDGVWDFIEMAHVKRLAIASRAPKCGPSWLSRAIMRTVNGKNLQIDDATVLCVHATDPAATAAAAAAVAAAAAAKPRGFRLSSRLFQPFQRAGGAKSSQKHVTPMHSSESESESSANPRRPPDKASATTSDDSSASPTRAGGLPRFWSPTPRGVAASASGVRTV